MCQALHTSPVKLHPSQEEGLPTWKSSSPWSPSPNGYISDKRPMGKYIAFPGKAGQSGALLPLHFGVVM